MGSSVTTARVGRSTGTCGSKVACLSTTSEVEQDAVDTVASMVLRVWNTQQDVSQIDSAGDAIAGISGDAVRAAEDLAGANGAQIGADTARVVLQHCEQGRIGSDSVHKGREPAHTTIDANPIFSVPSRNVEAEPLQQPFRDLPNNELSLVVAKQVVENTVAKPRVNKMTQARELTWPRLPHSVYRPAPRRH